MFHWWKAGTGYVGAIDATPVYLEQHGDSLVATRGTMDVVSRYLALDHPLREIYGSFPHDPAMDSAREFCRGLRIIRQPLWECLATFITSALKQVGHIAQISHLLRERYGKPVGEIAGHAVHAYPTWVEIARLQEADLRACGLGFRAVSLLAAARRLADAEHRGEFPLEQWRGMDRVSTLTALTQFRGVGTKVANCVLLFGYGHLDAFPIDVWIERVLRETYFKTRPTVSMVELQRFADRHFGPYGGYAQQYLFHQARASRKSSRSRAADNQRVAPMPARRIRAGRNTGDRR